MAILTTNNKASTINCFLYHRNGLKTDGVNDEVTGIGTTSTFAFIQNTKIFSISLLVRPTAIAQVNKIFLGTTDTSNEKGFYISLLNGALNLGVFNGNAVAYVITKNGFFTDASLVHIVVTSDGTTNGVKFYKNGVLQTGLTGVLGANSVGNSTRNLKIGNTNASFLSYYLANTFYSAQVYNTPINETQVYELYTTSNLLVPTSIQGNLVANWDFNRKSGTTLTDLSGNGLNGTLINFANTTPSVGNAWVDNSGNSILI